MEKVNREQAIIKICCVIAAFFLWLYVSNENNEPVMYRVKNVPVHIMNSDALSQSKLALLPGEEPTVTLTVKGPSPDVYLLRPDQFQVIADLSGYALIKGQNRVPIEIKDYPSGISIEKEMLWVKVNVDELIEKSVPVTVKLEGKTQEGYTAFQALPKPTDVYISGPAQYVNSVKEVQVRADLKDASQTLNLSLPLQAIDKADRPIKEITITPNIAEVAIPVKKVKTVSVIAKTIGDLPKSVAIKSIDISPGKVDIAGSGDAISKITSLQTEDIDISTMTSSGTVLAKLIVPKDVSLVNVNSFGSVNVQITLDKVVEKNFSVGLQYKNLASDHTATSSNSRVAVVLSGTQTAMDAIKPDDISASVDLGALGEGDFTLPININFPDTVNRVSTSPPTVKVTIKKSTQPTVPAAPPSTENTTGGQEVPSPPPVQ